MYYIASKASTVNRRHPQGQCLCWVDRQETPRFSCPVLVARVGGESARSAESSATRSSTEHVADNGLSAADLAPAAPYPVQESLEPAGSPWPGQTVARAKMRIAGADGTRGCQRICGIVEGWDRDKDQYARIPGICETHCTGRTSTGQSSHLLITALNRSLAM